MPKYTIIAGCIGLQKDKRLTVTACSVYGAVSKAAEQLAELKVYKLNVTQEVTQEKTKGY